MDRRNFVKTGTYGIGSLLGAHWGIRAADAAPAPAAVTVAFPFDVYNWDPTSRIAPQQMPLYKCLFDQPLEYAADSTLQPGLVKAWRWADQKGLALELEFRDDVLFHNGDRMTSADFKYTFFDRPRADKTLQLGSIWQNVTRIDLPSPTKAVVHLSQRFVSAPQYLGYAGAFILPKAYIEKVGMAGFMARPIGTGPYKLVQYQRDSRIVLAAFDKHWRGVAKVPNVTIQVVKDPTTRVSGVQSGQLALAANLPIRDALRLARDPRLNTALTPTVDSFLIHMVNSGALTDRNVRLAMHHAIDKAALGKAFFNGVAAPLARASAPGTPSFNPGATFAHAPDTAKALLAKAGYSAAKPVTFRFFATRGVFPNDFEMARAIVQMWQKVGINAALETIELAQYFSKVEVGKLEGPALFMWTNATGDPELSIGAYLNPKVLFSVWRSADVTPRLEPLLAEMDQAKRMAGYREFETWAVEQGYSLPLLQGVSSVVHAKSLVYVPYKNGWVLPNTWKLA
ncbi:peptide/nickel transport system substrate-binding protein [Pseudoduganella lurida]|uniref:Peptide/nickel transport system substrate-binding protein n=1 Tax=Pseudoduganella lurida TaxID=1036180 RepID=A0A562RBZ1_9BURK|nr:ABC transporter substrate-binding protein [Pseudoduganella lurida]TWI66572.1 peptide/nickel transport system substrate-binding protein [Pseudoduganella lurida]